MTPQQVLQIEKWVRGLELHQVPYRWLVRPTSIGKPDILTDVCTFGAFNLRAWQHECLKPFDAHSALLDWLVHQQDIQLPENISKWVGDEPLRQLLWLITHLTSAISDPVLIPHRCTLDGTSLLVELTPQLTVGYHGGRLGAWFDPLHKVRAIKPQRHAKSPQKVLRLYSKTPKPLYQGWVGAIQNYYSYFSFPTYALNQLLAYLHANLPSDHLVLLHTRRFMTKEPENV